MDLMNYPGTIGETLLPHTLREWENDLPGNYFGSLLESTGIPVLGIRTKLLIHADQSTDKSEN